jgi:hypothetical protein
MDSVAWNIAEFLLPLTLLAFLSHQAGEKIRYSKFAPGRAVGLSLIAIGSLGYSLLAFFIFMNFLVPLAAWAWTAFVK